MSGEIQQHMYTRERKGFFHDTVGYDTIAMSNGLKPAFVKKYLHPFCLYHSPKALKEHGVLEPSHYPPAVTIFQPETQELIVGQAVFVPADFTGTRSTYFTHTFVIPSFHKEEWVRQPEKIFQIMDFQTAYDLRNGQVLPELEAGPLHNSLPIESELLTTLGITNTNFQQLLFAIMSSISGRKKVFISLAVPLQDYTKYALMLLEFLYRYLPYPYRRKLGAVTFTSEPETRNYIHVTFFEPGALNISDHSIKNQFIFDFAGGKISGVDVVQHEYLEFASPTLSHRIDEFLEFAEMALSGLADEHQLSLVSYDQLTDLYLALTYDDYSSYFTNKLVFLNNLQHFLQANSEEKAELCDLFLKLLYVENKGEDLSIALDYVETVVTINSLIHREEVLAFLLDTLNYYQKDPLYLKLWLIIETDRFTYETIVSYTIQHPECEYLLASYLNNRIKELEVEDIRCLGDIFSNELAAKMKPGAPRDYFLILGALYKLLNCPGEPDTNHLNRLTKDARVQLSRILQVIVNEFPSPIPSKLLLAAFETSDGVDFPELLNFFISHFNETILVSFIQENAKLTATDVLFRNSLKNYLITHPNSIWKNKTWKKELQSVNDDHLNHLLKEVEMETANPLVKFLKKTGINL